MRAARPQLGVAMQPHSTCAGGWVCLWKVEEGWKGSGWVEGGGQRGLDQATQPRAKELAGGGGGPGGPEMPKGKTDEGGWRLDVDAKPSCHVCAEAIIKYHIID